MKKRIKVFATIGNLFAAMELQPEIPHRSSCPGDSVRVLQALAEKLKNIVK